MSEKRFNSYGEKRAKGSAAMMYGPGCCGHDININDPRVISRQQERCKKRDADMRKKAAKNNDQDDIDLGAILEGIYYD